MDALARWVGGVASTVVVAVAAVALTVWRDVSALNEWRVQYLPLERELQLQQLRNSIDSLGMRVNLLQAEVTLLEMRVENLERPPP